MSALQDLFYKSTLQEASSLLWLKSLRILHKLTAFCSSMLCTGLLKVPLVMNMITTPFHHL